MTDSVKSRIEASLDTIRPYLAKDGGNVEVVEITADNVLKVRLVGSCQTCPQSFLTLKSGIEDAVRAAVPEIVSVEAINLTC
jgi:Fe-S cluster biogenesis protein NfuA